MQVYCCDDAMEIRERQFFFQLNKMMEHIWRLLNHLSLNGQDANMFVFFFLDSASNWQICSSHSKASVQLSISAIQNVFFFFL